MRDSEGWQLLRSGLRVAWRLAPLEAVAIAVALALILLAGV
jgi:hypothetical protein